MHFFFPMGIPTLEAQDFCGCEIYKWQPLCSFSDGIRKFTNIARQSEQTGLGAYYAGAGLDYSPSMGAIVMVWSNPFYNDDTLRKLNCYSIGTQFRNSINLNNNQLFATNRNGIRLLFPLSRLSIQFLLLVLVPANLNFPDGTEFSVAMPIRKPRPPTVIFHRSADGANINENTPKFTLPIKT